MKAKLRKTGEIVDVISYSCPKGTSRTEMDRVSYINSLGKEIYDKNLNWFWDFEEVTLEEIELFKRRRYELSKEILINLINKSNIRSIPYSSLVADSVMCADLLMNNLKI